jgi:ribosome-associated translation inhibitor RaiA
MHSNVLVRPNPPANSNVPVGLVDARWRKLLERIYLMLVQVNTDNHTAGSAGLIRHVESVIEGALERFSERITRVEAHLKDESSSAKAIGDDKRCVLEARLAGLQPISVSDDGSTMEQALDGAVDKLAKILTRTLGRLDDPKGRTSYAGDPTDFQEDAV